LRAQPAHARVGMCRERVFQQRGTYLLGELRARRYFRYFEVHLASL
jgi:hypothetical protein